MTLSADFENEQGAPRMSAVKGPPTAGVRFPTPSGVEIHIGMGDDGGRGWQER